VGRWVADFSIQDAAFTGFGVVRQRWRFLAVWAGLALVASVLLTVSIISVAGPEMMILQSLSASARPDPAAVVPILVRLGPLYLVLIPCTLVFNGVLLAAMNRAVLRPNDHKLAYLAVGPDEFRQMGLLVLIFIAFTIVYIVLMIGLIIAAALFASVLHVSAAVVGLAVALFGFAGMVWLAVRLSLASALTFESRRVTMFGSWALTKGRFWPIFGTYVLVLALAAVIFLLTWVVILAVVALATGGNLAAAVAPSDFRSLGSYFTVAKLVQLVLGAGVSALLWPVILTPPAAILRHIIASGGVGDATRRAS
jgi:hypothetical protein